MTRKSVRMRPDTLPLPPVAARVSALNARYRHHSAAEVLQHALRDSDTGRIALVSSFGAESVVLLHMVTRIDCTVPVLFVDTGMLFPETLTYQRELAGTLGLSDLRVIRSSRTALSAHDPGGLLHRTDPDACCSLRKVAPLDHALAPFDCWITGRKRFQGGRRTSLDIFEAEGATRIKINPLAHWRPKDVTDYIEKNRLPRHPLVVRGYPSIGCAPCTSQVESGENSRAGRWRGTDKSECGIHFTTGGAVRPGQSAA